MLSTQSIPLLSSDLVNIVSDRAKDSFSYGQYQLCVSSAPSLSSSEQEGLFLCGVMLENLSFVFGVMYWRI